MADKTTIVRVTRTQKLTVVEYVDIPVYYDEEVSASSPVTLGKDLVEAMDAAGHEIGWVVVSEEPQPYGTNMKAEISPEQPAAGE